MTSGEKPNIEQLWAKAAEQLYGEDAEADATTEQTEQAEAAEEPSIQEQLAQLGVGNVGLDADGLALPLDLGGKEQESAFTGAADLDAPTSAAPEVTPADLAALAQVEAELDQRWPETKIEPSLDRIELLLDLLGNPQESFPVILVAGTNGKTSTARMIESLLRSFHRRTGLVTSPHLQLVTERIAIDGTPIHPRDYVRLWEEIAPYVRMADEMSEKQGGPRLSKFEVLTALGYVACADAPVDVAVVEVGMGGRWDATNVVAAEVAVITPIGLDHTEYLGDTLTAIAGEKAGIIRRRPVSEDDVIAPQENIAVIGRQEPEALEVLLREAVAVDAGVARAGLEFGVQEATVAVGGQNLSIQGLGGTYTDIFLPLAGAHQAENAATALAAVEAFFGASAQHQLDQDRVRAGFAGARSPGRLERVRSAPAIFIDAAHNPHGVRALAAALERDFAFQRLIAVVGVLGDKDASGILEALEPVVQDVVCTENTSPRALPAPELAELAREIFGEDRVFVESYLPAAVEQAVELAEDAEIQSGAGVIITGSVVTAGEARTLFGKEP